jgi:hypothetical protein
MKTIKLEVILPERSKISKTLRSDLTMLNNISRNHFVSHFSRVGVSGGWIVVEMHFVHLAENKVTLKYIARIGLNTHSIIYQCLSHQHQSIEMQKPKQVEIQVSANVYEDAHSCESSTSTMEVSTTQSVDRHLLSS